MSASWRHLVPYVSTEPSEPSERPPLFDGGSRSHRRNGIRTLIIGVAASAFERARKFGRAVRTAFGIVTSGEAHPDSVSLLQMPF